jgi:hypothetical protein
MRGTFKRFVLALPMVALLASPATAHAAARLDSFSETQTQTFVAPLEGCLPEDLIGTVTFTETATGNIVETQNGLLVRGLNQYSYSAVFPDGRSVRSGINRDIYVFVAHGSHGVYNLVAQDMRTIFAPDGTAVGTLAIHASSHITWFDKNGDGELDGTEISATFDTFRLQCR